MSTKAKIGATAAVVLCLVGIAVLASGSLVGLVLLLLLLIAGVVVVRRAGATPQEWDIAGEADRDEEPAGDRSAA